MDKSLQPFRAPSVGGGEVRLEPLGEDLCPTLRFDAPKPADADRDDDAPAGDRQIRQGAGVAAVHRRRDALTPLTPSRRGFGPSGDGQAHPHLDAIDDKAGRDDRTEMKAAGHGGISDDKSRDPSTRLHQK